MCASENTRRALRDEVCVLLLLRSLCAWLRHLCAEEAETVRTCVLPFFFLLGFQCGVMMSVSLSACLPVCLRRSEAFITTMSCTVCVSVSVCLCLSVSRFTLSLYTNITCSTHPTSIHHLPTNEQTHLLTQTTRGCFTPPNHPKETSLHQTKDHPQTTIQQPHRHTH